MNPNEKIAIIR